MNPVVGNRPNQRRFNSCMRWIRRNAPGLLRLQKFWLIRCWLCRCRGRHKPGWKSTPSTRSDSAKCFFCMETFHHAHVFYFYLLDQVTELQLEVILLRQQISNEAHHDHGMMHHVWGMRLLSSKSRKHACSWRQRLISEDAFKSLNLLARFSSSSSTLFWHVNNTCNRNRISWPFRCPRMGEWSAGTLPLAWSRIEPYGE